MASFLPLDLMFNGQVKIFNGAFTRWQETDQSYLSTVKTSYCNFHFSMRNLILYFTFKREFNGCDASDNESKIQTMFSLNRNCFQSETEEKKYEMRRTESQSKASSVLKNWNRRPIPVLQQIGNTGRAMGQRHTLRKIRGLAYGGKNPILTMYKNPQKKKEFS